MYPLAKIDLAAVKYNLNLAKSAAPDSKVMAVIKANAYGHGDIEVARALEQSDAFAVARLLEAIQLREAGINKPIVVFEGLNTTQQFQLASDYRLSLVFNTLHQIELVAGLSLPKAFPFCWLMVETGMHRLGIAESDVAQAYSQLQRSRAIEGDIGLMSHFANADLIDDQRNQQQIECMKTAAAKYSVPISLANSAAILSLPESHQDWIRPGIMLYGSSPFDDKTAQQLGLKSAMTLQGQLISISQLQTGDEVGYGGEWQASQPTQIGTVNIGYGDGYQRILSAHSQVVIRDQKVTVLGRVSMDLISIDLSDVTDAEVGDVVTLWGDETLTVDEVAHQAQTISYELLCQLNPRVTRQYHG